MGIQNLVVPVQAIFDLKKFETQYFFSKFQLPKINLTEYLRLAAEAEMSSF